MRFELSKRKAYFAIGLIVIVAVGGFVFYRYFVDWTGEESPKLKVIAKTDNSITLSWEELKTYLEEHDGTLANYYLKMSTTGEGDPTFLHSETWTEIWNTSNENVTSTTISDLSSNTDYWFYVAVNYHTYGMPRYGSNVIRTTTYPSLFQTLITLTIVSGAIAVALIFIRKPKWAMGIFVFLLLIQSYGLITSSVNASNNPTIVATKLWKFSTVGSVYNSPIIAEGYVYTISSFIQKSIANVYCLDASTGTQIWNYTIDTYVYTPLTVADGYVFTLSSRYGVFSAFNALTGVEVWNTTDRVYGPVIVDHYLYLGGSSIYKLDASTGTKKWSYTTDGGVRSPVVTGGKVYASGSSNVYCLYTSNGAKIWNYTTSEYMESLVVAGHYVYLGYNNRDRYANVVDSGVFALDAATGNQVWDYKTEGAVSSPIVADGLVYVGSGSGNVYALNASNGTKIWNYTTEGSAGSPVLRDPYVYVGVNSKSEYGQASVYCLDASTGAKIWNFATEPGGVSSSPVVVDGQVLVGNTGPQFFAHPDHYVYALNASTGEQIWNYTIEGNAGHLTVADGVVYVGATFATSRNRDNEGDGGVYALKPTVVRASLLPLTVIVMVIDVVILAVAFLVYRVRLKEAKTSPATSPTKPENAPISTTTKI